MVRLREVAGGANVVLPAYRTVALVQALLELSIPSGSERRKIPYALGLAADNDGITVRSIWADAWIIYQVRWSSVLGVAPTEVAQETRRSRGLAVMVEGKSGPATLPFVITGRGLGGQFPLAQKRLEQISQELELMRTASLSSDE
jgi:hypothetical protein